MDAPKALIEQDRISQVTEVGIIDGGRWADVLAVSYGPEDTTIRIRFETTGERREYKLPDGLNLRNALEVFAEALFQMYPYDSKPMVSVYRGHQAREVAMQVMAQVERAIQDLEAAGIDGISKMPLTIRIPDEFLNN